MGETHAVFLYGPDVDRERMLRRCASAKGPERATLAGWSLRFDRIAVERDGTGEANVVPDGGGVVEGGLYALTRADLLRLDPALGHPGRTSRRMLRVTTATGTTVAAWVYVATPDWRGERLAPRREDLEAMLATEGVFSDGHRAALGRLLKS